ncbi:hypothetical protein F5Y07DRAFT_404549 [Xylaria sp. FL0933]|nr:hypothetical protein F5Y07DRAFT_404549 [Xylaria sp. FL0933]
MDKRLDSGGHLTSQVKKQHTRLENSDNYMPVRKSYLQKNQMDNLTNRPPRYDREKYEYEDYLRNKWGCNDAMPDSFDPYKLDALYKARVSTNNKQERSSETVKETDALMRAAVTEFREMSLQNPSSPSPDSISLSECNASRKSISEEPGRGPLETHEQTIVYESQEFVADGEVHRKNAAQVRGRSNSDTSSRGRTTSTNPTGSSTPRIRAGSRPPLSRSAYVAGGTTCEEKQCNGQCKQGRGRVKPPEYFPFKSRARGPSRSRSKDR